MHFQPDKVYHLYNRGNEKQKIFFNRENYLFFLRKVRNEWLPYCDILAYCLMPNHFHFLIQPNRTACNLLTLKGKETHLQVLSKTIGKTLSSYTQAINIENQRTGNLFQKKTKAKILENETLHDYLITCFYYIHFNPVEAGLVAAEHEWEFSSFRDYTGLRNGTLCNKELLIRTAGGELDFEKPPQLHKEILNEIFSLAALSGLT
jgi:putative transposase